MHKTRIKEREKKEEKIKEKKKEKKEKIKNKIKMGKKLINLKSQEKHTLYHVHCERQYHFTLLYFCWMYFGIFA
jgi:hypothetical protein